LNKPVDKGRRTSLSVAVAQGVAAAMNVILAEVPSPST
jgi:hypothetical protein